MKNIREQKMYEVNKSEIKKIVTKKDRKFLFDIYQYLAPLVLTPTAFFLWNSTYSGNLYLVSIAVCIPILYAYIVPGIGTNVFKLWKFDSPFMIGNFRIHHGFIFGSATSVITWIIAHGSVTNYVDVIVSSFVAGSVLALWNTIYDIEAINAGVIKVFNQPYSEGKDASSIVMDYGPIIFGFFGAMYVAGLKASELLLQAQSITELQFFCLFVLILLFSIAVPVVLFMKSSLKNHGHNGLSPFYRDNDKYK